MDTSPTQPSEPAAEETSEPVAKEAGETINVPPSMEVPPDFTPPTGSPTPIQSEPTPAPEAGGEVSAPTQLSSTYTPPQSVAGNSLTTTPPEKESNSSPLLLVLGIILLLVVGGIGYLYYSNRNLKSKIDEKSETPTPEVTMEEFKPEQIQIVDGNVHHVLPLGKSKILVDKSQYQDTGITGFAKVAVSPDNQRLCFESLPPAPAPALYISGVDGTNVKTVAKEAKNCNWHKDSQKIVYLNMNPITRTSDIFVYDITNEKETNLTEGLAPSGVVRNYEITGISDDGENILCNYLDSNLSESDSDKKPCEVPITPRT